MCTGSTTDHSFNICGGASDGALRRFASDTAYIVFIHQMLAYTHFPIKQTCFLTVFINAFLLKLRAVGCVR